MPAWCPPSLAGDGPLGQVRPAAAPDQDRHEREFLFGPTHEEVITDVVRKDVRSYRQLPMNLYQIQVKFRDEIRPRFGVMRGREFLMKDAYSFDVDRDALIEELPGDVRRLHADLHAPRAQVPRGRGRHRRHRRLASHEFQVLADSGEDAIAWCPQSQYAANVEQAEGVAPPGPRPAPAEAMRRCPRRPVHLRGSDEAPRPAVGAERQVPDGHGRGQGAHAAGARRPHGQ